MPPDVPARWIPVRFEEMFTAWVQREHPDVATQHRVVDWIVAHRLDPYAGMKRETDFPNMWSGRIPGTRDEAGTLVTCAYDVLPRTRIVRCLIIGRVGWPM